MGRRNIFHTSHIHQQACLPFLLMDHLQLALLVMDVSKKDQWLYHRLKPQCHPCKAEEQIQQKFSSQATTAKPGREDSFIKLKNNMKPLLHLHQGKFTLRHWRRFSRALAPGGAAEPRRRGNAAWTAGTYEAPAMPAVFTIPMKRSHFENNNSSTYNWERERGTHQWEEDLSEEYTPFWLCEHWVMESTRKNRSTLRWKLGSVSNFRIRSSTTCITHQNRNFNS